MLAWRSTNVEAASSKQLQTPSRVKLFIGLDRNSVWIQQQLSSIFAFGLTPPKFLVTGCTDEKARKGGHPSIRLLSFSSLLCHQNRHSRGHFSSRNGQDMNYWCRFQLPPSQMGTGSVAFFRETSVSLQLRIPQIISARTHTKQVMAWDGLQFWEDVAGDVTSDKPCAYKGSLASKF